MKATKDRRFHILTRELRDDLQVVKDYSMGEFDLRLLWRGTPLLDGIPSDVKLIVDEGMTADFLPNPIDWPIFSQRAIGALSFLIESSGQFLPAPTFSASNGKLVGGYTVFNVTSCFDAINPGFLVSKAVVDSSRIPHDVHITRVPNETVILVSDEFVAAVRKFDLKGFFFIATRSNQNRSTSER